LNKNIVAPLHYENAFIPNLTKKYSFILQKRYIMSKSIILTFALLLKISLAQATTHTITFGSSLMYSPSTLNVVVGDIIQWQGAFGSHPLQSTSVPSGAAAFSRTTGTSFSYVVTTAGNYAYKCTFHAGSGMTGTFTATAPTATERTADDAMQLTVLDGGNSLKLQSDATIETADLQIYNMAGQNVLELVLESGSTEKRIDLQNLPSGAYIVTVCTRKKTFLLRRKFLKS
jgi:plastocyanin